MREAIAEWRPRIDEAIADVLPRELDDRFLAAFFGAPTYSYDDGALEDALSEPVWAFLDRGGKRWRAVLFLVVVDALGEEPEEYLQYACIPEILHNGTIIVDDVEDDAELRRGEPALHHEVGTDIALNAGNALYFVPLKLLDRTRADIEDSQRLDAYEMFTHELNRTHLGQSMDVVWHNRREIDTSESEYYEMCACKTGCLPRIVTRLAAILTGQDETTERGLARYAEEMSIAFQIGDDILDIEHTIEEGDSFGKAFGNDIREGKKSLMVIHAAGQASPERAARLEAILWAEDNTDEEIMEAIDILQATDSIEFARERARELAESARGHLDDLELASEPERQLREFTRFVIERER
jgi:geranylgeranyl diphosphate synthase type I